MKSNKLYKYPKYWGAIVLVYIRVIFHLLPYRLILQYYYKKNPIDEMFKWSRKLDAFLDRHKP